MEQGDAVEKTLQLQKCLQSFIDHVDALREEDDPSGDGFTREFRVIRDQGIKERDNNTYPAEEGKKPYNIKKNRYKDILPFDATRVTLDEIVGEEGSDYINANFVQDQYGTNCYIASQGPVQNTVYDFWRLIIQYKVKVIAMACRLVEMGKKKCEQYWPDELNETVEYRDISVTLVMQEDLGEHCTKRVMRASKAGCDSLTVSQFHYTGWPDHDIPNDFDVILEMMAEMRDIKSHDEERAPMVIHCSAGCGRTGTMIAIDFVWDLLKSGNLDENFNLSDIIKLMRTQRQSMIQAPEQYMMAHVTVQTLFQMHLDMMEDHTYGNIGFNIEGEDGDEKQDGSVSEAGSEASSGLHEAARKRSVMEQYIAKTIHKVTHVPTADEMLTATNSASLDIQGLPEPLTPTQAVYVAPPLNTNVQELKNKFSDDNTKDTKTFKIEKIDNIPQTNKIEDRYLGSINKSDFAEKKLSFVSSESRQKDIEAKKAMFDKPKIGEKPAVEQLKSLDKTRSSTEGKKNDEGKSNANPAVSTERTVVQRIESQQMGNKHVTVLSVGSQKPQLNKAMSVPVEPVSTLHNIPTRSKTVPKDGNPFQEAPQSSVPPETSPSRTPSVYSSAGNSSFYSSLSDYSSVAPKPDTKSVPDDHYSAIANYSSAVESQKNAYSYTYAKDIPGEVTSSKLTEKNTSSVYSYAVEPGMKADSMYAYVEKPVKPMKALNGSVNDAVYEPVTVGDVNNQVPPVLPDRKYIEEDENQNEKSGAGDTNTLGKKAQLTRSIKNLFGKGSTVILKLQQIPTNFSAQDTDQTLQDEDLQANGDDVRLNESNKGDGNKLTVSDTVEEIRPVDVDVEIVQTKSDMPDQLNHRNKPITETRRRKRQKITQEMVWEAQIQFFREQTATEIRRRQLMDVKEKFYTAATKALQDKEISDIMDILNSNTKPYIQTSDHVVPSDIPGFKSKLGRKPHGPKDVPFAWKKK